jgi:ubiquinone/menaquinone biosynthesis C-methylase UbiE
VRDTPRDTIARVTGRAYDDAEIRAHWASQALEHGASPSASWSDRRVIELEIDAIGRHLEPGNTVLDIGCANGYSSVCYAVERSADLTGIDYVPEMIAEATARRESLPAETQERVRFAIGDVRSLQFEDASVDRVISTRVIINLPSSGEQAQGLGECARVLRPGGLLLLSEATTQGSQRLNIFRAEWGLEPIAAPAFNRYLDIDEVVSWLDASCALVEIVDFASSYYVATRVLKPLLARAASAEIDVADPEAEFNRWAAQLPPAGDYGTQKLLVFRKR